MRGAAHGADVVRSGLTALAAYELGSAVVLAAGTPRSARSVSSAGPADRASFQIALGVLMLAAVRARSWRPPLLAFAALRWALEALGDLRTDTAADAIGSAGGAGVSGWLLARALRAERWASHA